jgi:hypothetical protein
MTVYAQQQPRTLADLLAMQQNAPGSPVAPPQAPAPSEITTEGSLTAQQRQSLIEQLLQPEPVGPAPVSEEYNAGKGVGLSLVDAFNNIASIYGGVNLRSNAFNDYRNRLERQKAESNAHQQRKEEVGARAKTRKAEFLLGEDANAREQALAASVRQAAGEKSDRIRKEDLARDDAERVAKVADAAAKMAEDNRRRQEDHKWDVELQNLSNARNNPDKDAAKRGEKEQQDFASGASLVGVIIRDGNADMGLKSVRQQVAEGSDIKAIAGAARNRFEEALNEEGIFGKARDMARNLFNRKMIELAENPPQPVEQP